jgi:hypothetical protein
LRGTPDATCEKHRAIGGADAALCCRSVANSFVNPPPHSVGLHPPVPAAVAHAHAELLTHQDLQFDFPKFVPPVTPQWMIELAKLLARIWPYAKYAVWAVVALIVLYLLYRIVREIERRGWTWRRKSDETSPAEPEWRPTPEAARDLLRDADALAARGQFAEAAHLLLLRSIEHIRAHKPGFVKPALTSREIEAFGQLPGQPRTAFASLVRVVEHVLFAGHDIDGAGFAICREAYERFAFPAHWSGALR